MRPRDYRVPVVLRKSPSLLLQSLLISLSLCTRHVHRYQRLGLPHFIHFTHTGPAGEIHIQTRCSCVQTLGWLDNSPIKHSASLRVGRSLPDRRFIHYEGITGRPDNPGSVSGRGCQIGREIQWTHPRERRMIGSPLLLCVNPGPRGRRRVTHKNTLRSVLNVTKSSSSALWGAMYGGDVEPQINLVAARAYAHTQNTI